MSWGYWVDLDLELSAKDWAVVRARAPRDVELPRDWTGLRDRSLASSFDDPEVRSSRDTFAKVLGWPIFRTESIRDVRTRGGRVSIRVAVLLDRSVLGVGAALAALLAEAAKAGGHGALRLLNDGTAPGEGGAIVRADRRAWKSERLKNAMALSDALAREIYGDFEEWEADAGGAARPAPARAPKKTPEQLAFEAAVRLDEAGDSEGARKVIDDYFAAGKRRPSARILGAYATLLRRALPRGAAARKAALDRVIVPLTTRAELANERILEDAVALMNESGAAAASIDLVLARIQGARCSWSPGLAANVAASAAVAKDAARRRRVLAALERAGLDPTARRTPFDPLPLVFANVAELYQAEGNEERALACVCRAGRDAAMRARIEKDRGFAPLRTLRGWKAALRGKLASKR